MLCPTSAITSASLSYLYGDAEFSGAQNRTYKLTRGNLRRVQDISPGWSLRGNINFQTTNDVLLPASDQFLIGGEGTVRGYQTGLYSGDKGYVLSAELHHPIPLNIEPSAKFSGFFFLDYGVTKPYRPVGSDLGDDEIFGTGWGINLALEKWLTSKLAIGFPLRDRPDSKHSYITWQLVIAAF